MSASQICAGISQRWIIVLACFLSLLNALNVQICLSIAITQMVTPTNHAVALNNGTCSSVIVDAQHFNQNESMKKGKTFDWDEKTQGQILSSYYWGYIIVCLFSGIILDKLGSKRTMGASILSTSLLTLLVPKSVDWGGATTLMIVRFLIGVSGGMGNPAIMRLMSRWIPMEERSRAAAWSYAGAIFGVIIGMGGSGAIIQRSEHGWPTMFYVYGAFGIAVFLVHCVICYDSPSVHPFITQAELRLLREELKHSHDDLPPTPWCHVIRSRPIWALGIAMISSSWYHITIYSDMPKFMSSLFRVNVETNGYISAIPHFCSWIACCTLSWIADRSIAKKFVSVACVRKLGNAVSAMGTGTFLLVATYIGCNRTLVVALQVVATMMLDCANFSIFINALDLAPNYAGAIHGVLLGVSIAVGLVSPYVAGLLTPNQTIDEWRLVFWLAFAVGSVTNGIFVVFGRAEVQAWNNPNYLRSGKYDGRVTQENLKFVEKDEQKNSVM